METVTVSRTIAAPPEAVREAMADREAFTRAAGFDEVTVSGDTTRVEKQVGLLEIALELETVTEPDAALAYEQRDGIFEEMRTVFELTPVEDGTEVRATTDFALDVALVGDFLDSTVIRRQRTRELEGQFDYLESTAGSQSTT